MKKLFTISLGAILTFTTLAVTAQTATQDSKTVATLTSESKNHSTLETALKSTTLDKTLGEDGPYTILAPTDAAFNKISKDSLTNMMQVGKEKELKSVLNYFVIKGNVDIYQLMQAVKDDEDGQVELQTLNGGTIIVSIEKDQIKLTDERGVSALIDPKQEVKGSNGVLLSIDTVLMPK